MGDLLDGVFDHSKQKYELQFLVKTINTQQNLGIQYDDTVGCNTAEIGKPKIF